jgi:hypothetical protein
MPPGSPRRVAPWLCLLVVLAAYLFEVARLHPQDYFGRFEDDTIYFSSAKALAEGQGYILPFFPGDRVKATKYPVLYPWLLSWVWGWQPAFPANLGTAIGLTALFGCWFLAATFLFLRKLPGLGDWPALFLVGLCALHPYFLLLSADVMSDVPFMALAMTAMNVGDSAMRRKGSIAVALLAGTLAGLSVEMRILGLAVVAGIFLAGLLRRAYRPAALFAVAAGPFVLAAMWPTLAAVRAHPVATTGAALGWRQTYDYTTSYFAFWRDCVPRPAVLFAMLRYNLEALVQQPGRYLVFPLLGSNRWTSAMTLVLSAAILLGVVRQARANEWKPIHFVFAFYSAILLFWNTVSMDRFLLPFLPLLAAGLWLEGKRLLSFLLVGFRSGRPAGERALAAVLAFLVLVIGVIAVRNYFGAARVSVTSIGREREAMLSEKREAYEWVRNHTLPDVPIVAYEDGLLYLYTGRPSLRPLAFSSEGFFMLDPSRVERDLDHLTDVARHLRARYWLMSDDDYALEAQTPRKLWEPRVKRLQAALPAVFRSQGGRVQIHDTSCLLDPERGECAPVLPVLFPEGASAISGARASGAPE